VDYVQGAGRALLSAERFSVGPGLTRRQSGSACSRLARTLYTEKRRGIMSDGREEREEREARIEQEKQEKRDDRVDHDDVDEWQPERVDS